MVHKRLEGSHSSLLSPASLYLGLLFQKPRWFSLIGNMTFHILQQSSKVHKVGSGDPTCNPLALSLLWSAVWCSGALPSLPWSPLPCWLITLLLCLPVHIQLPLPFSYRLVFIISFRGPWNGSGSREISFASNKWDSKVHTHTQSNTSMLLEVFQVSPRFSLKIRMKKTTALEFHPPGISGGSNLLRVWSTPGKFQHALH